MPEKVAKSEGGEPIMPITGISPNLSGRWRIYGTANGIEQLREIQSKKGPMKVFSFVLNDKIGQSIKLTSFAEMAEKFHPILQENGSYYVSGGANCIRPANKRFNSTGHDYEITLENDSVIEMAEDQTSENSKFFNKKATLDALERIKIELLNEQDSITQYSDKIRDIQSIILDNRARNINLYHASEHLKYIKEPPAAPPRKEEKRERLSFGELLEKYKRF